MRERFDVAGGLFPSAYVRQVVVGTVAVLLAVALGGLVAPDTVLGDLSRILLSASTLESAFRLATPIVFAALGGIFAEKSGVINIGLEGLLIVSAFTAVFTTSLLGPGGAVGVGVVAVPHIWVGLLSGVVASVLMAALFGVVCIEFKADQIIAGLAVWLIALGLAPFVATVYYGGVNSANLGENISFGWTTALMFVAVAASWVTLNHTAFGKHLVASGENPKALDTVGVDVSRVRHAGVLLSGLLSGFGGAALSLNLGQFVGTGQTMVQGKGFIAIVAYLFGNYNPLGAFGASMLFAGLEAMQIRLQQLGYGVPDTLVQTIPYVVVILVLAFVGRTRIPEAAGEHYETGEE